VAYAALVCYAAINIPIGRALATPLTWPMLRAARGALSDSILYYLTAANVAFILAALLLATLPVFVSLRRLRLAVPVTALAVIGAGAFSTPDLDTRGLERNVYLAFVESALPRVDARTAHDDWRVSPFTPGSAANGYGLASFRGIAAGRHVVLVSLESTAAQYLSVYGSPVEVTPHLTALARSALVFEHAYAVYPESIKGLYSILCSQYPAFDTDARDYERVPCRALPAVLRDAGYRTGLFHSGRFGYLGMESIVRQRGYDTLEDAGAIGGNHESSFGVDEPSAVKRMLSWIDKLGPGQPFFLTYLPIAGHHPYETPVRGPFPDPDELGRYRNALHYADAALGGLLRGLADRSLLTNTLIIVLGDHGEAFGQHAGNYGHTFFLYDENVRVPFIAALPGALDRPQRVTDVVSLVDTAPTILDLVGKSRPDEFQGESMLTGRPRMALFFTDYSLSLAGLRDRDWKFSYELRSGRARLFNVHTDSGETEDLAGSEPKRVTWYRQQLLAWSAAQKSRVKGQAGRAGRAGQVGRGGDSLLAR
jgi:arylsulfatase A-like enzyme